MESILTDDFSRIFTQTDGAVCCFAPGRINLIGEHIDYSGGHVLPCALSMGTYCVARRRSDRKLRFFSKNFPDAGMIECDLDALRLNRTNGWANYALGVLWALEQQGMALMSGMDMYVCGNIPNGAGLSSSASLEVLTGFAAKELFGFPIDMRQLAVISQRAENSFVGVKCGIMDQMAIAMGRSGCALFINTATLNCEYIPMRLEGYGILIMNTRKRRELVDSKYNQRRAQCAHALAQLRAKIDIASLCELSPEGFQEYKSLITDPIERKRVKHAVYENMRASLSCVLLQNGDTMGFGKLMNESHISLRDDYDVTGTELDTLVECAWEQQGVAGARMTGGGFGGCALAIAQTSQMERISARIGEEYLRRIGYAAEFYTGIAGDGPRRIL
ncbi:MAG: galactokinase [Clostridia bacterium]